MKDNRTSILDATERLLRTEGLARLTTREIAREAGVAEGLIYHYFTNKAKLIVRVVERRMVPSNTAVRDLPLQVGLRSVAENLEKTLWIVYCGHHETAPIVSSTLADKELRGQLTEAMKDQAVGPQNDIRGIAAYLAAEQRLGRVADGVDPQTAAACMWKIIVQTAMEDLLTGRTRDEVGIRAEIRQYLRLMMGGLEPRIEDAKKSIRKK